MCECVCVYTHMRVQVCSEQDPATSHVCATSQRGRGQAACLLTCAQAKRLRRLVPGQLRRLTAHCVCEGWADHGVRPTQERALRVPRQSLSPGPMWAVCQPQVPAKPVAEHRTLSPTGVSAHQWAPPHIWPLVCSGACILSNKARRAFVHSSAPSLASWRCLSHWMEPVPRPTCQAGAGAGVGAKRWTQGRLPTYGLPPSFPEWVGTNARVWASPCERRPHTFISRAAGPRPLLI